MTNKALNITAADKQLIVLPMYHSYGLITQSIGSIISGCELKIDGPPFNANRFADLIRLVLCGRQRSDPAHFGDGRDRGNVGRHRHRDLHYSGDLLFGGEVHDEI